MRNILIVLLLMILMIKVESNELRHKETNNLITQFDFTRVTYQGIDGYFIPIKSYIQLTKFFSNSLYAQDELNYLRNEINSYWKLEKKKVFWQNAFVISLAYNISISIVTVGIGFLCYNLAKY